MQSGRSARQLNSALDALKTSAMRRLGGSGGTTLDGELKCNYHTTMANITVRNIPDDVFERIKALSSVERRSINNELLRIIERGTEGEFDEKLHHKPPIAKSTQLEIWSKLLGKWEDRRSTAEILEDIYSRRTVGRKIEL